MKNIFIFLVSFSLVTSCSGPDKTTVSQDSKIEAIPDTTQQASQGFRDPFTGLNIEAQLMQVMRRIFQDSKGNIWFIGDDVFCYDGNSLIDFSEQEVFSRNVIRRIDEDSKGNLWFGTYNGIVKYDPSISPKPDTHSFTQFTQKDGLIGNDVWGMTIDSKDIIWVGTLEGVTRFDPMAKQNAFTEFPLPESEPDLSRGVTSAKIVHSIMEDSKGKIWFGTNGGAYIFGPSTSSQTDQISLSHISEQDGLCNNLVNDILEDRNGNIWFATHHNGVCYWDGTSFIHINSEAGIESTEAWSLYEDQSGNIWFPIEHEGVYHYNSSEKSLSNLHKNDGLLLNNVHSALEDKEGRIWFGGFGGLYLYDPSITTKTGNSDSLSPKAIINITKDSPFWSE